MKWKLWLLFSLFCFSSLLTTGQARPELDLDTFCVKFPHNSRCQDYIPPAVIDGQRISDLDTGYPIVNREDWYTEKDLPWSELVMLRDVDRNLDIAVLDRDYPASGLKNVKKLAIRGMLSNWNRQTIEIYGLNIQEHCVIVVLAPICNQNYTLAAVSIPQLKVGETIYPLHHQIFSESTNNGESYLLSHFVVTKELAELLTDAPPEDVWVRFYLPWEGARITRQVGQDTVEKWSTLYQDVSVPLESELPEIHLPLLKLQNYTDGLPPLTLLPKDLPEVDGNNWAQEEKGPWSTPVWIKDAFDGDYLAVLDRQQHKGLAKGVKGGFLSNWNRNFVEVYFYGIMKGTRYRSYPIKEMMVQVGEKKIRLVGTNNRFPISAEVAEIFRTAPEDDAKVTIYVLGVGKPLELNIGQDTVKAWQTVYQR